MAASLRPLAAPAPRISAPVPAPAPPPAPSHPAQGQDQDQETGDLTGSLLRLRRYVVALGPGGASVDQLLAGPPVLAAAAIPTPAAAPAGGVVPMRDLTFTGPAALDRALSLRAEVTAALEAGVPREQLTDLIQEVFDLVQLGNQRSS
jgi:hypothetical protein